MLSGFAAIWRAIETLDLRLAAIEPIGYQETFGEEEGTSDDVVEETT